jgi:transcriptional regulator with GAF, ATPase, and Fis domain
MLSAPKVDTIVDVYQTGKGGVGMTRFNARAAVVIAATALVVAYCIGLLVQVHSAPDLGMQTTFSLQVGRFFPQYLRDQEHEPDVIGATIRQVGPYRVENWPQFIRRLRDLQARHPQPSDQGTFEEADGVKWVLVALQRGEEHPFEVWCQLGRTPLEVTMPALLWLVLEVGLFAIGAFVYWKQSDDRYAGPFFALTTVAVGAYLGGYHWSQLATQPVLTTLFVVSAVLLPAVTLHFYHVFPRPKSWLLLHPRRTLLAIYGAPCLSGLVVLVGYFWVRWLFRSEKPSDVVNEALAWHRLGLFFAFIISALWFSAGIAALVHSYWRAAEPGERNQVRVLLVGSLAALAPIGYSLYLVVFAPLRFVGGGAAWPMFAASAAITVAFTVSITRYRLLRLDRLIGSGVSYFLLSFFAVLVYYVLVFSGILVGSQVIPEGPKPEDAFRVSLSAIVMLLVVDLVRARINRSLEQYYRRDKHQLDRTLHQLSDAIEHLVEPPTLARHLLDASADLLAVSRGALFLSEGDPPLYRLAGSLGKPPALTELAPGCPLVDLLQRRTLLALGLTRDSAEEQLELLGGEVALALSHEGRLLGFLILGPKATGFYQAVDYNLLSAVAPIAALALQSAGGRRAIEALNREVQLKVEKISEQQERILALQRQLVRQGAESLPADTATAPSAAATADSENTLVGSSAVVGQLLEMVRKVAASPSAVLIRGESGTGKELIARAVHDNSPRTGKPFVKVHCAALSPTLLESELFGHVKGAFTGASGNKVGRFEMANGGTLFLDEIGDITADVQIKLLRVLQEKIFERVGSSEPVRVDVRIVAATHQDLEKLIREQKFRDDLFYRLNVIPISVPPLRERREDVPELVYHFLRHLSAQAGRPAPEVDDEAMDALRNYAWPGNIRQLRNVIERAVVVADGAPIGLEQLPEEIWVARVSAPIESMFPALALPKRRGRSLREERQRREREEVVRALAEARGNKAEAARALGIPRSTLLSRMQKHGLT